MGEVKNWAWKSSWIDDLLGEFAGKQLRVICKVTRNIYIYIFLVVIFFVHKVTVSENTPGN